MLDACVKCGLFTSLRSRDDMAFGFPAKDYEYPQVDILVVVSKTDSDECQDVVLDPSLDYTKMLIHFLELSGHSYDFLSTTLCMTHSGVDRHIKACSPLRQQVLLAYKPKIVVCFGAAAVLAVVPGGGSVNSFKDTVTRIDIGDQQIQVMASYHPSVHFSKGKSQKDLASIYEALFTRIDRILAGEEVDQKHELVLDTYEVFPRMALEHIMDVISPTETGVVADDIEYGVNSKNPMARTMWFPDTPIVCDAFSTFYDGNYHTICVDTSGWSPGDWSKANLMLGSLAKDKGFSWWGSNYKTDMTKKMIEAGYFRQRPPDITYQEMLDLLRACFPSWDDSQMISWMRDQSGIGNGLKTLAHVHLGAPDWSRKIWNDLDTLQLKNPLADIRHLDRMEVMEYCAGDAWRQAQLGDKVVGKWIAPMAEAYSQLKKITEDLMITEWVGMPVDIPYFQREEILLREEIRGNQEWLDTHPYVDRMGWKEFNVKSPQRKSMMAVAMGFDAIIKERTPSGMVQINKKTVKKIIGDGSTHEGQFWGIVEDVRILRDRSDKFFSMIVEGTTSDEVFHPDFKVVKSEKNTGTAGGANAEEETSGTETGRLGCTLHIIPKDDSTILAGIYVPQNRGTLIIADFKSVEPMVNGCLARCKSLINMFRFGKENPDSLRGDVYITACSGILTALGRPKSPEEISPEEREWTKPIWLGSAYDQGPYGLSKALGCPYSEAEAILHAMLHVAFPELLKRSDGIRKSVLRGAKQVTMMGRRRDFELMVNYLERYPDTIKSDQPYLLYELEEAMLAEDKRKGRDAPFKSNFGKPMAMLSTDQHTLREACNFHTQEPANAICLAAKRWMADNSYLHPSLYHWLAVHDSIKLISYSKGQQLQDEMAWVDSSMTTPSNYLLDRHMRMLGWDEFNPLRVDISYGPTQTKKDSQKFVGVK